MGFHIACAQLISYHKSLAQPCLRRMNWILRDNCRRERFPLRSEAIESSESFESR
jgi:hypothetical protein